MTSTKQRRSVSVQVNILDGDSEGWAAQPVMLFGESLDSETARLTVGAAAIDAYEDAIKRLNAPTGEKPPFWQRLNVFHGLRR